MCIFYLIAKVFQKVKRSNDVIIGFKITCNDRLIISKENDKGEFCQEVFEFCDIKSVNNATGIKITGKGKRIVKDKKELQRFQIMFITLYDDLLIRCYNSS